MKNKIILNLIAIAFAVVLGVILGSRWNNSITKREIKTLQDSIKTRTNEVNSLIKHIATRELIIADGVKRMDQKDSLHIIEKNRADQAQKLFLRERKLRIEQLKQATNKEKEDIIIKRYR